MSWPTIGLDEQHPRLGLMGGNDAPACVAFSVGRSPEGCSIAIGRVVKVHSPDVAVEDDVPPGPRDLLSLHPLIIQQLLL